MVRWHFKFAGCFQGVKPSGYWDARMSKAIQELPSTDLSCGDRRHAAHPLPWSDLPDCPAILRWQTSGLILMGFLPRLFWLNILVSHWNVISFHCLAASGPEVSFSPLVNELDFLALVYTKHPHIQQSLKSTGHTSVLCNSMPEEL